jgi:hypothetical protein
MPCPKPAKGLVLSSKPALINPGFVPESEFYSVTNANLVVNYTQVIADDLLADTQLLCYLPVFHPARHQFNNALLSRAWPAIVVSDLESLLSKTEQLGGE